MIWRLGYILGAAVMTLIGGVFIALFEWGAIVIVVMMTWLTVK